MTPEPASPRGSDYAALSRQVRQAGLLDRRPTYYAWKITLTAAALVLGWAAFAAIGNSWWQLADAVFLAVAFAQIGFLGHDAGHSQVFRSRRANTVLGVACGNLGTGVSYDWWSGKHNRHHAHPNTEGADPDIMIGVLAFSAARARAGRGIQRLIFRYQAYLLVPMLFLEALGLHASSIRTVTGPGCRHRAWEATLLAVHFAAYLGAVFFVLSPVKAVVFILVQQGLLGFYLGCLLRAQPQGDADPRGVRQDRLPAPPGADLTQRPRWLAHRLRPRRPELPDRAPSLPVHATAELAPGADTGSRVLRRPRACRTRRPACSGPMPRRLATLRPSAGLPARPRSASPPRYPLSLDRR